MSDQEQELYMAMGISELESEITTLTTERDEWKRSADLVTRTLISTKADLEESCLENGRIVDNSMKQIGALTTRLAEAENVVAMARAEVDGTDCWKWEKGGCLMFDGMHNPGEPQCPYCDLRDAIAAYDKAKP